jgi:alpha-D-xyloside xylohydrolase
MTPDPVAHARATGLVPQGEGRFATSLGPLAVSQRDGVVRLVLGDAGTLPDYGFVDTAGFAPGAAALALTAEPLTATLLALDGAALGPITDEHFRGWTRLPAFGRGADGMWSAAFALPTDGPVYGGGEQFGTLNKRGQLLRLHVADALGVNTAATYKPLPFVWGFAASGGVWGVLANTPCDVWVGAGFAAWSNRSLVLCTEDAALDLFLFAEAGPAALLRALHQLTGAPARPPDWSFGVWLSKAYYRDAAEIVAAAQAVRARRMPCDVITFDGRAWQDTPTRFHFHWDAARYPDAAATVAALKAQELRVCCWEYPLVAVAGPLFAPMAEAGHLLRTEGGDPYVFRWDTTPGSSPFGAVLTPLPESGLVDFTNPAADAAWRDCHAPLFATGMDVVKSDFGEQVPDDAVAHNGDTGRRLHNAYPALYNRCVMAATQRFGAGVPMLWGRAGWIGAQREPIRWGGDPQSDWDGLAASLRGALSYGMSGVPYHATDIGGFHGARQPDAELFLRWLAVAVFASHLRFHGIGPREPWAFGAEAEATARHWLEWRMRLVPYLWSVADDCAPTGLPVMRAMPLAFPNDRAARAFPHQFLCGDALLVAPILRPGGDAEIWLPDGGWTDLFTGERHGGARELRMRGLPLDRLPVFGRAGQTLPLGRIVQHTGEIDRADPVERTIRFD